MTAPQYRTASAAECSPQRTAADKPLGLVHSLSPASTDVMCAAPCVPAGPFETTLSYDASPLAQPLLGSGKVEFAVPVYSKAAALMAMVATYAAAAGASRTATIDAQQYGSVAELVGSAPTNPLQVRT